MSEKMKTYQYIENCTGKVLKEVNAQSFVLAEEFFETHFWYLPIIGFSTKEK